VEAAFSSVARPARELPSDKAARIVEAMRASVAVRGAAGSTFDHVAREAGVSRGLLHYYFGTKERLLTEVVRRECEIRHELLESAVAGAQGGDDVINALVRSFEEYLCEDGSLVMLHYELLTLAQRNEEIAGELAELGRRMRAHLAEVLNAKHDAGVLRLAASPDAVAGFLFALADGLTVRALTEPTLDMRPLMGAAVAAARGMLG
jgi:AcrR family transcriptional regulator